MFVHAVSPRGMIKSGKFVFLPLLPAGNYPNANLYVIAATFSSF
jgi:hypothetical protein